MYNENYVSKSSESEAMRVNDRCEEALVGKFKGEVIDTFIYPDGRRELVREMDYNLVVNNCEVLIAALMKGESGYAGLKYWAVGSGSDTWSNETPPTPQAADAQLTTEFYRKPIAPSDIVFLDSSNVISLVPTNKLQITVTFEEDEANGALREFGLYGGTATAILNSGTMINRKIHPLVYKYPQIRFERILRITF